jgi:hypothetical protein
MTQQILADRPVTVKWLRCKDSFANIIGWCLEKLKAPAKLKEFEFIDPETDETVYLSTGRRFTVLYIGSRRFYFDRLTGEFDGTSAPACPISGRLEFRD